MVIIQHYLIMSIGVTPRNTYIPSTLVVYHMTPLKGAIILDNHKRQVQKNAETADDSKFSMEVEDSM